MSDQRCKSKYARRKPASHNHRTGGPPPLARVANHKLFLLREVGQSHPRYESFVDRAGDAVARWAGDVRFFVVHAFAYSAWMLVNAGLVPGLPAFDPYPFGFLGLLMALEVSCLSTAVLMRQNRQSRQADQRALLDLQVNLLAEQEATKMLQILQAICGHLGLEKLARDRELAQMTRGASPGVLSPDRDRAQVV